jgi:DNA polymerase III subunit epsilon
MAGIAVTEPPFLDRYRARFDRTWDDDTTIDRVRFVVLDSETTGLNPRVDRLVTIGAVVVQNDEILLDHAFDAMVRVEENTTAVTVHGVTRDESRLGLEEPEALARFLDYLGDGVIVGHHIDHDIGTFDAALERHWGFRMSNRSLDTMDLTLHLEKEGAFAGRPAIRRFTLDALCDLFGVIPHDRHTASGDAFITAQVFLRLLRLASRHGRQTLGRISQPFLEPGVGPSLQNP